MIDHDKAYLIGLIVGGGTISGSTFLIKLPFKKWGADPHNMNKIAADILTRICSKFQNSFNISVTYEIGNNEWSIIPIGNENIEPIVATLSELGLPTKGFLLNTVDLEIAKKKLNGISIESFLTGIFDARASLTLSHRRFTSEAPVVSLEIPGSTKNFKFVVQFCSWITKLGSTTDQILYNHPCQHSASDPNYKGWKKGFKIRFLVKSFIAKHSFALRAKSIDLETIERLQVKSEQEPCISRKIRKPSPVCVHKDINSSSLPQEVRKRLFFHYFHFCAKFGCPYAPLEEIRKLTENFTDYIFILPRLEKGHKEDILISFMKLKDEYFLKDAVIEIEKSVSDTLSDKKLRKYEELEQSIAYLFSPKLNGKRHIGPMKDIIQKNRQQKIKIIGSSSDDCKPIVLINEKNNRAAILSALESNLNQKLIRNRIFQNQLDINILK